MSGAGGRPLPLRFLRSAANVAELPDSTVELAIVGRSNVGKSSLVNALANKTDLAKVSKTPGATRLINVFELPEPPGSPIARWLVDLPGYGYAKVSESERRRWQGMIEGYLTGRDSLREVILLIDAEIGPTALDLQTVEWLEHIGFGTDRARIVATKVDKVGSSRRLARRRDLAGRLGRRPEDIAWVSAAKGIGMAELRSYLTARLGA